MSKVKKTISFMLCMTIILAISVTAFASYYSTQGAPVKKPCDKSKEHSS